MCDTLFRRAAAAGNVRMQTVALCVRLDHFYYKNDRAEILEGVRRVQEFCRKHPKEDLRYFYYFVWSSRLITYYIKQNQPNTAIYETRKMLAEAEEDDYPEGVAACYRMLANLYLTQGAWRMAYDNFRRQIEVLEHNGIDDINLPTQYASLAQCALELDMPDSAFVALQKAASLPKRTTYQEFTVNKGFGLYYIRTENFAEAKKRLEASEELFRRDPSLRFHTAGLSYLRTAYFKASGQYRKALETILETQRDTVIRSSGFNNYALTKEFGDVYWHLREMERAAANYREYIRLSDSVRNREIRTATDDFSGILEISRLHNETKELQYDLQRKRLRNTYLIICLLAGVLVTGGVGYARMMKLNRRLKASEATVLAQNEHLRISGEELLEAKEQAEQASRMKTEFIQHMSHEVRTPLNSIVGFSQVLASEFRDKPATGEYASIIEANSATLLRLFRRRARSRLPRPDGRPASLRRHGAEQPLQRLRGEHPAGTASRREPAGRTSGLRSRGAHQPQAYRAGAAASAPQRCQIHALRAYRADVRMPARGASAAVCRDRYRTGHSRRSARRGLRTFRENRSLFAGGRDSACPSAGLSPLNWADVCSSIRSMRRAAA